MREKIIYSNIFNANDFNYDSIRMWSWNIHWMFGFVICSLNNYNNLNNENTPGNRNQCPAIEGIDDDLIIEFKIRIVQS